MTPCTYRIDRVFEEYFPEYWKDRLCYRIERYYSILVGTKSGLLCHLQINERSLKDGLRYSFRVYSGINDKRKPPMSDYVHIFLIGPQGSGKTTLAKELERRGYEQIVAYTTRPPRGNEIDGVDYHFITSEEFNSRFLDNELTCIRTYSTVRGVWSYAFALDDLYKVMDSVAVIDPESYLKIHDQIENVFGIYLDIPDDVRKARLLMRGDDPEEVERRMKTDAKDFATINSCFREVCKMRIGMVRRPDIDADRIEGHIREFRDQIFRGKNMAHNEGSNL